MILDPKTGEIQLSFEGIWIGRSLSREQLLASPIASKCRVSVRNEPFCTYILPTAEFEGHTFVCSLQFQASVLESVCIVCADPEFGSSWNDLTDASQVRAKAFYDALLARVLGEDWPRQRFPWGVVYTDIDAKAGFASIGIRYR